MDNQNKAIEHTKVNGEKDDTITDAVERSLDEAVQQMDTNFPLSGAEPDVAAEDVVK